MNFSAKNRKERLEAAAEQHFDLAIVGGGITGAGIALDASLRGLKVLLLEKNDFASGTSSKSTKLIHGGLRYLKQFEFSLVREVGLERAILHNLLPHLVVPEKMLLPIVKNGSLSSMTCAIALSVYDYLASVNKQDKKEMLNPNEVTSYEPLLTGKEDIIGGAIYAEYRTDDARLTLELIKEAHHNQASCFNYTEVLKTSKDNKGYTIQIQDRWSDDVLTFNAKSIVNAGGPWTDRIINRQDTKDSNKIFLSKGVHLVIDRSKLDLNQSIYFDIGDGRMMFAIPRLNKIYFGTTDTPYQGDINQIDVTVEDTTYLIDALNRRFPEAKIHLSDVESCWAGLRPLIRKTGKSSTEMSRKDEVFVSDSGIISIAGGKLTGYRKMAERVVDMVLKKLQIKGRRCTTAYYDFQSKARIPSSRSAYHNFNYGAFAAAILNNAEIGSKEALSNEYRHCIVHESCTSPLDYFLRRSGKMYFDIKAVQQELEPCLELFAKELNWDNAKIEIERKKVLDSIERHNLVSIKKASIT